MKLGTRYGVVESTTSYGGYGNYVNIAVMESRGDTDASRIQDTKNNTIKYCWEKRYAGSSPNCQANYARNRAEIRLEALRKEHAARMRFAYSGVRIPKNIVQAPKEEVYEYIGGQSGPQFRLKP